MKNYFLLLLSATCVAILSNKAPSQEVLDVSQEEALKIRRQWNVQLEKLHAREMDERPNLTIETKLGTSEITSFKPGDFN